MARAKSSSVRTRRRPKQPAKVDRDAAVDTARWTDGADISCSEFLDPAWLSFLSDAERREAFLRAVAGEAVVAARYVPAEDCFGGGIDPLGLVLATPGLIAVRVAKITAAPAEFDPGRCQLRFALLAAAPPQALDQHWQEQQGRITRWPVTAADLVLVGGATTPAPVLEDFREQAMAALAAGDIAALTAATATLLGLMGEQLKAVAALRWLSLALQAAVPNRALLEALIEAVGSGHFTAPIALQPPADAAMAAAEPSATAPRLADGIAVLARDIVAVKRCGRALDRKELR